VNTTVEVLTYNDIKNIYTSGYKSETNLKIGLEYERIPVLNENFISADYYSANGICNFLKIFAANDNWDYILDNEDIIGLKQGHDTITLEPGSQIELSLEPQKNITDIEARVEYLENSMEAVLSDMGISLLNYGVSPLSTYNTINLIPKKRYHLMAKYLWGILSDVMMRETAGVQGTFDFTSEEDAMLKFRVANLLSPFITAMFANSPIRGGVDTGYKSFRALSWLYTDDERCGFFYDFREDYSFDDYIKFVFDTPMIFVSRNNDNVKINGSINFEDYLKIKHKNIVPNIEDYILQANLCFPEVRLRNFIEVRNHDCNGGKLPYALLAIYKSILYNRRACEDIVNLLKHLKLPDVQEIRYNVPKYALDTYVLKYSISDYAKEILSVCENSLKEISPEDLYYFDSIKEFTMNNLTPADVILKNWYGSWDKDVSKLIEFVTKK